MIGAWGVEGRRHLLSLAQMSVLAHFGIGFRALSGVVGNGRRRWWCRRRWGFGRNILIKREVDVPIKIDDVVRAGRAAVTRRDDGCVDVRERIGFGMCRISDGAQALEPLSVKRVVRSPISVARRSVIS